MNKIYKLLMLFGVVAMIAACNEDTVYYTLPDQPDEMHVKVSFGKGGDAEKNIIKLTGTYSSEEAVKLTWNAIQSDAPVTYLVRFYATNNKNVDKTEFYEVDSKTEFSITHNDLNFIVSRWALPGDELPISAEVVGTIHNEKKYIKPQVSAYDFKAVGWEKYPHSLFIRMTAPNGNKTTAELTQRNLGSGVYAAQIDFTPCKYHFTKTSYADYPAYYAGSDGKLLYVDTEGDYKEYENAETGMRTIIVDVNDEYLDSRILNFYQPAGFMPYIVGDATDIGWNTRVAAGYMSIADDPRTPYIYSWSGQFYAKNEFPDKNSATGVKNSEGAFKILLNDEYGGYTFYAPEANCNPLNNHKLDPPRRGGPDTKWVVPATGKYTFTINVLDMTTSFEPIK